MSKKWPGGIITPTPSTPTGPYQNSSAPGIWTLSQVAYWVKQSLWPTAGLENPDAFIENLFSTYLYTGNGATQTITNGIDLAGKGGLVWTKARNVADDSRLFDTSSNSILSSSLTNAKLNGGNALVPTYVTFNTDGFYTPNDYGGWNTSAATYASWTFRKQPKFFDMVTYTGNGVLGRTVPHSLGSVPGCMIIKCTSDPEGWFVYHQAQGNTKSGYLNYDSPFSVYYSPSVWNNTTPTSTEFTLSTRNEVNGVGKTFVAYLFAHNAGGFGLTGTDNVVSCGSFTTDAAGSFTATLGYEPQFFMFKRSDGVQNWYMTDTMRGFSLTSTKALNPNTAAAEFSIADSPSALNPTATGINGTAALAGSAAYVYIAIRRGPMKVPTDGTKVFAPVARTGTGSVTSVTTPGFPVDMVMIDNRLGYRTLFFDKLRGANKYITSVNTAAEATYSGNNGVQGFLNTGVILGADTDGYVNFSGDAYINWNFQRAPSFFDEVCYTGTGAVGNAVVHNLGVAPELLIIKGRSGLVGTNDWQVLSKITASDYVKLVLNAASAELGPYTYANNAGLAAQPTSTTFTVNNTANFNNGSTNYVAYLFATCPGVSKVGSYTGTGATQTIACGFAGGARFVLIKRTDNTGNWGVLDTARGMVAGTDPYLSLNTTAAEVNANNVYTATGGFQLVSSDANFNASGGTFIFLAIA